MVLEFQSNWLANGARLDLQDLRAGYAEVPQELSNLIAMASNLVAMASKLVAMASNLIVACPCFSVSGKCKRKRKLNSGRRGIVGSEDAAAFDILHLERVVPSRLAPILTRMY